jgi:hypothetical protein
MVEIFADDQRFLHRRGLHRCVSKTYAGRRESVRDKISVEQQPHPNRCARDGIAFDQIRASRHAMTGIPNACAAWCGVGVGYLPSQSLCSATCQRNTAVCRPSAG